MTANELCRACGFTLLCCPEREITGGVYCCDLLSMVMGHAPTDGVWFTVMANQNTIVAALMADVSCVVLTEGIRPDDAMLARAKTEGIAIAATDLPSFEAATRAHTTLCTRSTFAAQPPPAPPAGGAGVPAGAKPPRAAGLRPARLRRVPCPAPIIRIRRWPPRNSPLFTTTCTSIPAFPPVGKTT